MNKKFLLAVACAALLFACGDDSSSGADGSQTATGVDSTVESVDDLLNCTSKHEGETAYIKEENATYVCTDGEWVVAGESGDEGDDNEGDDAEKKSSSSTAKSADSKGKSSSSDKEVSSSSVTLSEVEGSSSSSVIPGSDPESSSSVESSSSEGVGGASSSSVIASSSSEEQTNSSSSDELSSSSLTSCSSKGAKKAWDYLNPSIDYGEITDSRDCQVYKTVEICNKDKSVCQTWMAENLNYADSTKTPSLKGNSWCYDNKIENCAVTGRLYTWAAAIDSVALANDADNLQICGYGVECTLPTVVQGICPDGWHLPTNAEWRTLFDAVGGEDEALIALISWIGWDLRTEWGGDRDAYGFSALPAGKIYKGNLSSDAGSYAYFWSTSQSETSNIYAYYMLLDNGLYAYVDLDNFGKNIGISVRCLQN